MEELLPLLACPETGETDLRYEGTADEGLIHTPSGRAYPVIGGVPRMLPADLLAPFLARLVPDYATRWPAVATWLQNPPAPDPAVLDTLMAYSFQHVDMGDERPMVPEWTDRLDRYLDGIAADSFAGEAVLDVGCGGAGQAWVMATRCRLMVGLDLSTGFENVLKFADRPANLRFVQGDLARPPFRAGAFDTVYSHGVLHHTPDPDASYRGVVTLTRPGGRFLAWVYGLDGMRLSYRLSHLSWLRPLSNRLPRSAQLAASAALTVGLEVGTWTPGRLLARAGLNSLADRLPYADGRSQSVPEKFRRVFDRLNPPVTHYLKRADLEAWAAGRGVAQIRSDDGRGWFFRLTPSA